MEYLLIIFLGEAAITLVCWDSADVDTALTDLSCRIYMYDADRYGRRRKT